MNQSNISTWLKFALQQMAAESYLDQLLFGRPLRELLLEGNNDTRFVQPDANGNLPGKTRFTNLLADRFLSTCDVIDHHANDATGFSATLMRDTTTGAYTLSFRSTESAPAVQGGDRERDFFGADVEIGTTGFALGQLAAMEEYYQALKTSGLLLSGATLNVTGFSLGGHLATVFTELHANDVNHTYIFNGTGRGHMAQPTTRPKPCTTNREPAGIRSNRVRQVSTVIHAINGRRRPRWPCSIPVDSSLFNPLAKFRIKARLPRSRSSMGRRPPMICNSSPMPGSTLSPFRSSLKGSR